ncbi:hypothetical protein [Nocardiopsis alba]|uniref:hypothetical protein n=1 Tax=Nocardiopsis alba TaxID=53437 RepID=UPI003D727332
MTDRIPRPGGAPTPPADAVSAFARLREALSRADIVLPSLDLDPVFFDGSRLVQLGRVNAETASRLARVIERGAAA